VAAPNNRLAVLEAPHLFGLERNLMQLSALEISAGYFALRRVILQAKNK
jgi:hypothetical protein